MKDKDFRKLLESVQQAGAIASGGRKPSRVAKFSAPDIKLIRRDLAVSQGQFASMIGVSVTTLQNWEQGAANRMAPPAPCLRSPLATPAPCSKRSTADARRPVRASEY